MYIRYDDIYTLDALTTLSRKNFNEKCEIANMATQ